MNDTSQLGRSARDRHRRRVARDGVRSLTEPAQIQINGSAGVQKFALLAPAGFPDTIEAGGKEIIDGPAIFPTAWFSGRSRAIEWLKSS